MKEFREYKIFHAYIRSKQYDLAQPIVNNNPYFDIIALGYPKYISQDEAVLDHKPYQHLKPLQEQTRNKTEIVWLIYNDDMTIYDMIIYHIHNEIIYALANEIQINEIFDHIKKEPIIMNKSNYLPKGKFAQKVAYYHLVGF